jgi:hypothetical protein
VLKPNVPKALFKYGLRCLSDALITVSVWFAFLFTKMPIFMLHVLDRLRRTEGIIIPSGASALLRE